MKTRVMVSVLVLGAVALAVGGCALLGVVANAVPKYEPAKYNGLQNQTVAVMVWADRGIRIDYPSVQLDACGAIYNQLIDQLDDKQAAKELKGAKFPYRPQSIVRFQADHPEMDGLPITDIAPRLGVSRLIYVEIEQLATRSAASLELYRGSIVATVRVVEVANGKATVVYTENNVGAIFPPKSPAEGVPGLNDYDTYLGAIRQFSIEVANRFITHEVEQ